MKRVWLLAFICLLGCSVNSGAAAQDTLAGAQAKLKSGSYKEAIAAFKALVAANPENVEALAGLIQAETETGEYAQAEQRAREFLNGHPNAEGIQCALAEIELQTGRYKEAASDAERAAKSARSQGGVRPLVMRMRALAAIGQEEQARDTAAGVLRLYTESTPRSADAITMVAYAAAYLEKFKDANELFIDAREADPTYIEAYIGQGQLLNQKYSYGDAASLFQDALKINGNSASALLGLASSRRVVSSSEVAPAVDRALQINPNSTEALVIRAWIDLEDDRPEQSSKSVDKALSINPNCVDAMAIRAASFFLSDKRAEFDAEVRRALVINPKAGGFYDTLAQFAVIKRRYEDAVQFGQKAVELSPNLWSARTQLGIQLLRVGRVAEGRAELERAFKGDPYNIWAKNALDLLDSMHDFNDTVSGPFIIRASQKESPVLASYASELLNEAFKTLSAKYHFTPRSPISAEIFANHEDFAVRSLGLPGLGALGVCFGQVIAMDSPAARNPGEFNWGSTLWHEFTHVITLQMTNNRIPRWFSEGLSVYEERRARSGWGDNWSLQNLKAVKDGRFVKIAELDSAFLRPKAPDGVPLAYFQASQVCEFIEAKYGFDAILRMLAVYKQGAGDRDALQQALQLAPEAFDRAFDDYIRGKTSGWIGALGGGPPAIAQPASKEVLAAAVAAKPDDYFAHVRLGSIYKTEGDTAQAVEHLKKAIDLFPYFAGDGSPYLLLADIYTARGEKGEALAVLEALVAHNETSADALAKIARLKLELGDKKGAAETLRKSFYVQPFDAALHKLAGGVYLELGSAPDAIREFKTVVALAPPDAAEAHYDLARALEAGGNRAEAKREVLRALEIAPGFDKAQELLLKLRAN